MEKCCRVVLTGGPGGGKTTAADLYRREIGDEVVVVPEAATLLYLGGFPRAGVNGVRRATQRAIYHVQLNLEDAQSAHYRSRVLLCDRGTVDGAVIFFETAAVGGISIEGGSPTRIESIDEALSLDRKLKSLWSRHPHFIFVPHNTSFIKKVNSRLEELAKIVTQHHKT